jgi:hypothetical protein
MVSRIELGSAPNLPYSSAGHRRQPIEALYKSLILLAKIFNKKEPVSALSVTRKPQINKEMFA